MTSILLKYFQELHRYKHHVDRNKKACHSFVTSCEEYSLAFKHSLRLCEKGLMIAKCIQKVKLNSKGPVQKS